MTHTEQNLIATATPELAFKLQNWINHNAAKPERMSVGGWLSAAENAANSAPPGYDMVLEMSQFDTLDKTPATIHLDRADFTWTQAE